MNDFLRGFREGRFFRIAFWVILRSLAVLVGLAGIVYWIGVWITIIRRPAIGLIVGWFVAEVPYALALAAVVWLLWQRGGEIRRLAGEFLPNFDITGVIVRLIGEVSAAILSLGGIASMFMIWAAGERFVGPMSIFLRMSGSFAVYRPANRFLLGLGYGVYGVVQAIVILLFAYFLAEMILLFKGILENTSAIRQRLETHPDAPAEAGRDSSVEGTNEP